MCVSNGQTVDQNVWDVSVVQDDAHRSVTCEATAWSVSTDAAVIVLGE